MHYVSEMYRNVYTASNTDGKLRVMAGVASETSDVLERSTIGQQSGLTRTFICVCFVSGECKNLQELNLSDCGNVTVRKRLKADAHRPTCILNIYVLHTHTSS